MASPTFHEISTAKNILVTATTLMDMENAAQLAAREKDLSVIDEFVCQRASSVEAHEAGMLRHLGEKTKRQMTTISDIRLTDGELFDALFGIDLPPGARIEKKPYVIQFSLYDRDYERTCLVAGMKPSYADSEGLCPTPRDIRPEMREILGNSITMVRVSKEPIVTQKEAWSGVRFPIMGIKRNFYARTPSGLKRLPVEYEEKPDPLTARHEELHGYQAMMIDSGYIPDTGLLECDLFEEEAAECIPEAEMGAKQKRSCLIHTSYFDEHDLRESRANLPALARKMIPNKPGDARKLVAQRDRNEYALFRVYESAGAELKKLVGWALHFMDFYNAHRIIPAMRAVYETT
ncbi:MAG: hypothetical protein HY515_04455 [Candidatus Aenigmarchaeota archaeon]|nr:hypothetical protein [Candidatus Aenigmarchaeota archaeon]